MKITQFSPEEEKRLLENRDKIVKFINDEIVPYLKADIIINFGDTYQSSHYNYPTKEWHLICSVVEKIHYDMIRDEKQTGHISYTKCYGDYNILDFCKKYDYLYALIENWADIKDALLKNIEKQKNIHSNIMNFSI